jgi:transcriptional regulator with XRE-family HTH domain
MSQRAGGLRFATAETPHEVGRRLASVRVLRGITQAQLAEGSGVTEATISRAESGTYSADTLVKLNRVLATSLDYILYGEGAP